MVETFCLRLALGMIAPLILLDPRPIPPRFFRVQFLVALGLLAVAAYFLFGAGKNELLWFVMIGSAWACFVSSIIWHTDRARGGRVCIVFAVVGIGVTVFLTTTRRLYEAPGHPIWGAEGVDPWCLADNYASALMLGTATTAMLLGHSYLISPAMTIVPLQRMLAALAAALTLRVTLAVWGLWLWTADHPVANLNTETLLWLSARWLLGIFAPLALGWMAWETTRIRSTQSATGILYVVVVVVFLGELTSLLLLQKTGSIL